MIDIDNLRFATRTVLENQSMDFSPEIEELKTSFAQVEKQIEFLLSTLQYLLERGHLLTNKARQGKISGAETNTIIIPNVVAGMPTCVEEFLAMRKEFYFKISGKREEETALEKASRLLLNKKIGVIADKQIQTLDTSGREAIISYQKYKDEMDKNNEFYLKLTTDLKNRSKWELWDWKMPELETFRFDVLRLNRTVKKETLQRKGIFTRKVVRPDDQGKG